MTFNCPNPECGLPLDDKDVTGDKFECTWCGQSIEFESSKVKVHKKVVLPTPLSSASPLEIRTCPKCGHKISASTQKCSHCEAAILNKSLNTIRFVCPQCGQPLEADANMTGLRVDCPACLGSVTIPKIEPPSNQPETTHGLSFEAAIEEYETKQKQFFITPFLMCFPMVCIMLWLMHQTENILSKVSPTMLATGLISYGILIIVILFKNAFIVRALAPKCSSCGKIIRNRGQINKCEAIKACPFCGYRRPKSIVAMSGKGGTKLLRFKTRQGQHATKTVPSAPVQIFETNNTVKEPSVTHTKSFSKGCVVVLLYILALPITFIGVVASIKYPAPITFFIAAVGFGLSALAGTLRKKKKVSWHD